MVRWEAGRRVELDELVAVRAEDERHVQAGRAPRVLARVLLRLLEPTGCRRVRALGFDDSDRHRLRLRRHLDPERVVRPPGAGPPGSPLDDLDRPRRLLAPDQLLGPPGSMEGRIEKGTPRGRLVHGPMLHVRTSARQPLTGVQAVPHDRIEHCAIVPSVMRYITRWLYRTGGNECRT